MNKLAQKVARRFLDGEMARRVVARIETAKTDRVLVKTKGDKLVRVKPETLKEHPEKYQVVRKEPGRNPDGRPTLHKDKLPEPPELPKPALPDPGPKPKKLDKPPKPVPVPKPPKPKAQKPAPGQPGWKPSQRLAPRMGIEPISFPLTTERRPSRLTRRMQELRYLHMGRPNICPRRHRVWPRQEPFFRAWLRDRLVRSFPTLAPVFLPLGELSQNVLRRPRRDLNP